MQSLELLHRIATSWYQRARVRSEIDLELQFIEDKLDFLPNLLPFSHHDLFIHSSEAMKFRILSAGWILYNAKTITIETDIVNPVCQLLLNEYFCPLDFVTRQLITETMVDETYHIHLCIYANEITKKNRNINLQLACFEFVNQMRKFQAEFAESWQRNIIQLITAITTEIYITDYLELVHDTNEPIQPLNSLIVKTHRSDELIHEKIFSHLAEMIFSYCDTRKKAFFAQMLPKAISWLAELEWDLWLFILKQLNFSSAERMITECRHSMRNHKSNFIKKNPGFANLVSLADRMGIFEYSEGKHAFMHEGLT